MRAAFPQIPKRGKEFAVVLIKILTLTIFTPEKRHQISWRQ